MGFFVCVCVLFVSVHAPLSMRLTPAWLLLLAMILMILMLTMIAMIDGDDDATAAIVVVDARRS